MFQFAYGGGIAASQQFGTAQIQTDIFSVDNSGLLNVFFVEGGGEWQGPRVVSPNRAGAPGTPLAASRQFGLDQTDVFLVDESEQLTVFYVSGGGVWQGPLNIGMPGLASSGTFLAASQQYGLNQTDVFFVDKQGRLTLLWVDEAGEWNGPAIIGPTDNLSFIPGAPVAAAQQFGLEQTNVYLVNSSGQLVVFWVDSAGAWQGPGNIGPPNFAQPGSHVAVCQQAGLVQTDVFLVDNNGQLNVFWVAAGGPWSGPLAIGPPGFASPGVALSASPQFGFEQTHVLVPDSVGDLLMFWVQGGGAWQGPVAVGPYASVPGPSLIAETQQFGLKQTDVCFVDVHGNVVVFAISGTATWAGPFVLDYPQSFPTKEPIAQALANLAEGNDCKSIYLDTEFNKGDAGQNEENHAQGLARTHLLSDGSIYFFLSYSGIGAKGTLSQYHYTGPVSGAHVAETDPTSASALAAQVQVIASVDEHPADIVFLPDRNYADAGYLFVTEEYQNLSCGVYTWQASRDLVRIFSIPYGSVLGSQSGPNLIFVDRVGDAYYLGLVEFSGSASPGLLYRAECTALFPSNNVGAMDPQAFQLVPQSEIFQGSGGTGDGVFTFPYVGQPCQQKLVQDSLGSWYVLGFRGEPEDQPGANYVDVYSVTFSPLFQIRFVNSQQIDLNPGDTGFDATGTHFVESGGILLISSSDRWSSGPPGQIHSRVDETASH